MISLRPPLITEHHSGSSLNDLAREASPSSRYLRPARDEDTTYTVGGNCSRVDGDKRTDNIETRSYSPDASVDVTEAPSPKSSLDLYSAFDGRIRHGCRSQSKYHRMKARDTTNRRPQAITPTAPATCRTIWNAVEIRLARSAGASRPGDSLWIRVSNSTSRSPTLLLHSRAVSSRNRFRYVKSWREGVSSLGA
jgi:hypothetical protein